ncbi:hypothetical protein BJ170DRAFT_688271 [Xylariales sp. AK1849]|nr:hypothetical protein BJ170DRAFT_688271 [Xylariales sp. AK1849]
MSHDTLSQLAISVRKSATNTLTVSVTNHHDATLTLLRWKSPLDPLALQLGVFGFTPSDGGSALEIPTIQVRRKMPPGPDSLVTIEPGQTKEQELQLREPIVPLDKLKGEVTVSCQGRWTSVWQKRAEEISIEALDALDAGDEVLTGEFAITPVVLSF